MTGVDQPRALEGRTILVTGGAVRVGASISRAVVAAGGRLAIHCHHHFEEAQALAREIRSANGVVEVFQADLMAPDAVRHLFDQVEAAMGPIAGLVNNAGLIDVTPLTEY